MVIKRTAGEDSLEEWFDESSIDPDWDGSNEHRPGQLKKLLIKLGALIALLTFLASAYAWLPLINQLELDFLEQNQALSEEELVGQCKPAVVHIQVSETSNRGTRTQGTGFNLSPSGVIITNRHVVEDASSVQVGFGNDIRFFSKNIEFIEGYDLAVIRLQGQDLPYLPMIADQMVEKGQTVTIIGNPMGFQRVSTRGQVESIFKTANDDMQVFSINTTIAPGSSGSPVLDEKGSLVGIVYAAGVVTVDGKELNRAFAIPASVLPSFQPQP